MSAKRLGVRRPGAAVVSDSTGRRRRGAALQGLPLLLIGIVVLYLGVVLLLPLATILTRAFGNGLAPAWKAVTDPDALAAIRLTLIAAGCAVVVNTIFGLAIAWLVTRFEFPGRRLLLSILDVPLMVSPVVSGMLFVLLLGTRGIFGPLLDRLGLQIIFATPGIVLVTIFVTLPYVARELIPFMQTEGAESEVAAVSLGARGWTTFRRITLPAIRWSLLYGVVLCAARAIGEFGAVSVVSGHIRGVTNTATLHVEVLYDEYRTQEAFAVAAALTLLAFFAVIARKLLSARSAEEGAR